MKHDNDYLKHYRMINSKAFEFKEADFKKEIIPDTVNEAVTKDLKELDVLVYDTKYGISFSLYLSISYILIILIYNRWLLLLRQSLLESNTHIL